ncbi:MAG: NAD(P) transhydrogenase subunit alpha [Thermoleophilia bacterium]|nr:NAD(P) transhydrogenase subunit alpha [Thermoleophilia bacterium]
MNAELIAQITVLVLAAFVGFEVISKVPTMLHTPLMSATNAIHGVVLVGALLVLANNPDDWFIRIVGFVAVVFGTMNVVGGFVVTGRMLELFKPRQERVAEDDVADATEAGTK